MLVTPAGAVDTRCGDGLDGSASKQVLALGAPEELAGLVTNRLGELESARQPAHFAQSVCEVPFRFGSPATMGLLTSHPGQLPAFLP